MKKVCYRILAIAVLAAFLFVLGMVHVWLMLFVLLLIVVTAGVIHSKRAVPGDNHSADERIEREKDRKTDYNPTLILVGSDSSSPEQIVINKNKFTIGRSSRCDYSVKDSKYISGVHVTIRTDPKRKQTYIIDNRSHNGTFVNNARLIPDRPEPISVGDVIQIGTMRFTAQAAHF